MWMKSVIDFLLTQGVLGIAVLCIGYAAILFYRENQKMRKEHTEERQQTTDKFVNLSNEAVKYIQENSHSLKELRDDIKEDRQARERVNERMVNALEEAIRDYRHRDH